MATNCPKSTYYNPLHNKHKEKDKLLIKRCPYCSFTIMNNQDTCEREECEGDKRLATWEKWMKIRTKETDKLGKLTKRPPVDLVMNLLEKVREDKERKTVLEHAQIEKKVKIRGGTMWQQPQRLKQTCPCKSVYEVHRTLEEKGRPRVIEHIGVPKLIQSEEMGLKGISERPTCPHLNDDYEHYRDKREKELKEKIIKLDPYKPAIDDLIIKGRKPADPPKEMPSVPVISFLIDSEPARYDLNNVYALKINDNIFYKELQGQQLRDIRKMKEEFNDKCTNWSYYFNVPKRRAGRSEVILQNVGTVAIRYCWKLIKKPIPFISDVSQNQVFFFNKNEDVISPGQTKIIAITFFSNKLGLFQESWELFIGNISFFDTLTEKFVIHLIADVTEDIENIKKSIKMIKHDIIRKAKYNIVRDILEDTVAKATVTEPQPYAYKHMIIEGDIFVMKNPVCFYHQTVVKKMKDLYEEMSPGEEWDLSIGTWRKTMIKKDFDERMMYYAALRKSHGDLLKPWYEGDELRLQKHRSVKQLLIELCDKFEDEYSRISERLEFKTAKVRSNSEELTTADPLIWHTIHGVFYLVMREHIADTVEVCAGVISSLDRNKWIEFDFCRFY